MNWAQLVCPAALLYVCWAVLPIRLPHSTGLSNEDCLTLSDAPPNGRPGAIAALERCSAVSVHDVELLADLGAEYESAGRVAEAEEAYQRALAIDPLYADLRLRLGRLLLRRGARDAAGAQAEAALRVQPNRQALLALLHEARVTTSARRP